MARIEQISLGVTEDRRAGRFWAAALGYVRRPPRYDGDDWIVLEPPPGVPGAAMGNCFCVSGRRRAGNFFG